MNDRKLSLIALVTSVALLGTNVWLLGQNRGLRQELAAERVRTLQQYDVDVGTQVAPLTGLDLDGEPVRVDFGADGGATLLLIFTVSCGICDENWGNWERLVDGLPRDRVRVVLIDVMSQSDASFVEAHALGEATWIKELDPRHKVELDLNYVPQVILLDSEGRVAAVATGRMTTAEVDDFRNRISGSVAAGGASR